MARFATAEISLPLAWGGGLFAAGCLAQLASGALWSPGANLHIVWFPGGVLLAALLSAPIVCWLPCAAGLLVGIAAVAFMFQMAVIPVLLTVLPVVVVVPIFAHFVSGMQRKAPIFENFLSVWKFLALAAVLLPLISGTAVYLVSGYTMLRGTVIGDWRNTVLAHALGYMFLVPAWLSLVHHRRWLQRDKRHSSTVACAVVLLVLLWFVWHEFGTQTIFRPVLLLMPVAILTWATFRLRMPGTYLMLAIIVIIAARMCVEEVGPFEQGNNALEFLSVQLWALALAIVSLLLSTLIEQRRTSQRALVSKHREVRELAGRLIAAQEQERTRIARDLHDDISQRIASSSIQLSALRRQVDPAFRGDVSQVQNELISLSNDIRHISHELHPSILRQTGLVAALNEFGSSHGREGDIEIKSHISPLADRLYDEAALCLYRAAQEAIGNAIRHGKPRHILVSLGVGDSFAELTVIDDGMGFKADESRKGYAPGLGLVSIDERAKLLGGGFEIQTTIGKGTTVCIRIPTSPHPMSQRSNDQGY